MYRHTWSTQAQSFVADELVGRETVVELYHLDIPRAQTTLTVHSIGCLLGHVIANLDGTKLGRKSVVLFMSTLYLFWTQSTLYQKSIFVFPFLVTLYHIHTITLCLTIFMQLSSWKVLGRSVASSMATISTACASRPCLLTKSSLHSTAAALPSEVGLYGEQQRIS